MALGNLSLSKIREYNDLDFKKFQFIMYRHSDSSNLAKDGQQKYQFLEWGFPIEKLEKVCQDIQRQVGEEFTVLMPAHERQCILIVPKGAEETEAWLIACIKDGMKPVPMPTKERRI